MKLSHVYCLIDPRDNRPFYIGTAINLKDRLLQHISNCNQKFTPGVRQQRAALIKEIISSGGKPIIKDLKKCTQEEAGKYEIIYYNKFKRKGYILLQAHYALSYDRKRKTLKDGEVYYTFTYATTQKIFDSAVKKANKQGFTLREIIDDFLRNYVKPVKKIKVNPDMCIDLPPDYLDFKHVGILNPDGTVGRVRRNNVV